MKKSKQWRRCRRRADKVRNARSFAAEREPGNPTVSEKKSASDQETQRKRPRDHPGKLDNLISNAEPSREPHKARGTIEKLVGGSGQ
jgi:hypothetical protein